MNVESNQLSHIKTQLKLVAKNMDICAKKKDIFGYHSHLARHRILSKQLNDAKEQVEAKEFFTDMTSEDRLRFNLNTSAISILSDLMYGYIVDSNSLIQKHDPYSSIEQFDSFLKAGAEAKKAHKFFLESGTDSLREELAQASDEILMSIDSMLKQKVSKILINKSKKK